MIEQQLVSIETKIAFQEHTVQELNDVICRQQQQIDKLEAITQMLIERLNEYSASGSIQNASDEKPPHY